jgi:hypothetical protein
MRRLDLVLRMALGAALLFGPVLAGCGGDDEEEEGEECTVDTSYNPSIDPASFVDAVDNPLFPLVPGTTFTYSAGANTVETTVLPDKKVILGVTCTVVHDAESGPDGDVIEDTYDWYAQDTSGAVWYFGEDTKELSGGDVVSTEGSWEAGVDGAKPGTLIPAAPMVGQTYRQEYSSCVAEDMGEVLAVDASATVPYGSYMGCLQTHDYTPLEEDVNENKYYCPGVGLVLSIDVATSEREELLTVQGP